MEEVSFDFMDNFDRFLVRFFKIKDELKVIDNLYK